MSKERYLNCKYLDAGMDGMLCSRTLCTTCKEFKGEKCSYYMPKNKSKDKEKQIVELMKDKEFVKLVKLIDNTHPFYVETIALRVYEKYQPKLPKDSVVLSKAEYNDLKGLEKHFDDYLIKEIKDTRKETAEKYFNSIIQALEERKDRVKAFYGVNESVGVDIAIRTVEELAKQFGVEIKE